MSGKGKVKPNNQAAPGPIGNTQGLIVPQTQPNASGPGNSAPPPKPTPKEEGWWNRWGSDALHTTLDVVGLIPGVGEVADGANALVYLAEGDKVSAALSAAAMLPIGGQAATAAKMAKKGAQALEKQAAKKAAEEAVEHSAKEAAEKAAKEKLEREALAELVQRRFEREVVLEVAENGRKAADTAVLWGADLILMDIEMPGMSGLDAARAVLAQRPSCRVIFVTAYSLFQYAHEAVHLGACDYLLKPVDPDELEASVRRAMRQIETERKLEELAAAQPQPEQTETEEEAKDAPEEGENSQTALVMAHVRRYLEDNYMFDLSLDSVGEILHISPAYLSAQFKKYQKMNFLDCLTELRINAAKELLADPFRSSAEVASMVGYEDASYFARAFKKRTGMTPTQYRRQASQKAKADPEAGL